VVNKDNETRTKDILTWKVLNIEARTSTAKIYLASCVLILSYLWSHAYVGALWSYINLDSPKILTLSHRNL